jgi:hypothetical protein
MKPLSLNKPAAPAQAKQEKKPAHPLDLFTGKRIVLQAGPVTYAGELSAITTGWIILKDATITGNRKVAKASEVFIGKNQQLQHVHLESAVLSVEVLA